MSEFLSRMDPVTAAIRPVTPVAAIAPVQASASQQDAATTDEQARAAAEYARVHSGVSSTLSAIGTDSDDTNPDTVKQAEQALLSLLPQPTVVHALPPANEKTIAFVAGVTQMIARQAQQARAAMANVSPALVDAVVTAN